VESASGMKNINVLPDMTIGVLSGASTPDVSIMEVINYMSQNIGEVSVSDELKAGVEESLVTYREGKRVKGTVISCDEKGIRLNIGGKNDGIIYAEEAAIAEEYNMEDFPVGSEVEAMIIGKKDSETGCILLSKKKIDLIKEADKVIESIRGGEVFNLLAQSVTKGGLLGKLGTYTVFIPASQIREKGYPKNLDSYVKKELTLTALDIDDTKRKIVASQKKVLETERTQREEIFWTHVRPNVIVSGVVKRITNFGAFVSVDGFDCLAHIVDLSWNHIKNVEEVLKKDESYDFIVLSVDREKGRVSLGYKQLQPHPYTVALQNHPVGSVCKGKVVSIVPFGAFVQIEPGLEGLVHVSEASHSYVKNINEVLKVGDEVEVMVLAVDELSRRITLSIKACLPQDEVSPERESSPREGKERRQRNDDKNEWNEETSNNPFADLLKNVDLDK
jgi:4-hydroxy-3-methylbut-2-enyl diphosphate reductase